MFLWLRRLRIELNRVALSAIALLSLCVATAFAAEDRPSGAADQPSCVDFLAPKTDTESFISLLRFVVLEKKGLPLELLERLAESKLPTNPVEENQLSLSAVDAHSARIAFDRLVAQGELAWDVITAEARALSETLAKSENDRGDAEKRTAPRFQIRPVDLPTIKNGDTIWKTDPFTSSKGETYLFIHSTKFWLVDAATGHSEQLAREMFQEYFVSHFFELRSGKVLFVVVNLTNGLAVYDAKTGLLELQSELPDSPALAAITAVSQVGPRWKVRAHENAQGEIELLFTRHEFGKFKKPLWFNTKTKALREIDLPEGGWSFFGDALGNAVAYGKFADHAVAIDLVSNKELFSVKPRGQWDGSTEFYRDSMGRDYLLTYETENNSRVIAVYRTQTAPVRHHLAMSYFRNRDFVEDGGGALFALQSSDGASYAMIDLNHDNAWGGAVPFDRKEFEHGEMFIPQSRTVHNIPGIGLAVIWQHTDVNSVRLGFYNLKTGLGYVLPIGNKKEGSVVATYVTPEGRLYALYHYREDDHLRFVQIYGPSGEGH